MSGSEAYQKKITSCRRWYRVIHAFLSGTVCRNKDLFPRGGVLPQGGSLILANHVTRLDQFIISMYYGKSYIRFVSGENVFKNRFVRWFAEKSINIIIHMRGVSAVKTVLEMTKSLKQGENVMIFPSGSMTFSGQSQVLEPSIAKTAKMGARDLVLLQIHNGYFLQPRWGITTRKGKIRITETVLTAEEIRGMTTEELTRQINQHLYVDAYAEQAPARIQYPGKKLCKGLECCLYECPKCGSTAGLKTSDTQIFCSCGFSADYDAYGYLHDREGNELTIRELCSAQKQHLKDRFLTAQGSHEHLFGDDFRLTELYHDGRRKSAGTVRIDVFSDVIEYSRNGERHTIEYSSIESVFVYMRNTMEVNLTRVDHAFELQGDFSCSALKYRDLYQICAGLSGQ